MARYVVATATVGLAIMSMAEPARAQEDTGDWRYAGQDGIAAFGWDHASRSRDGDIVRVRTIRSDLPLRPIENGIPASIIVPNEPLVEYDYEIAALVIDCARNRFTADRFSKYDRSGNLVASEEVDEDWYPNFGPITVVAPRVCERNSRLQPEPHVSTREFAVSVRDMATSGSD
ncbi:hypothetical protein [Brevundimonas poindexterae]|uniref:hypothetical protein n=1 Tax=Brevundimonas poindexterae TaxID=74325 RepID=UPI001CFC855C|nr:hypothetical protein [Brevundimonas poindexterae]